VILLATAVAATLSLRDAVAEALAKAPQATAAKARGDAARARLAEARAMWLPKVDVTETAARSDDPVFVFAGLLQQGRFGADVSTLQSFRAGLNVRYTIFDQLRRFETNAMAKNGVAQAEAGYDEARQRLRYETLSRFYGVALAEAKRGVADGAVRAAEAQAKTIRDKFEQGLVVESDLLATEVQLAEFRQQEIEAEGDAAVARAALATLLQRSATDDLNVDGAMPERTFADVDVQQAITRGLATRGDVAAATAEARNAELGLRTARGALLPRVDALANWSATGSTIGGRNPDHTLAVMASLDLFDRGKLARIAEARAGVEAARAEASAARDAVTMEIVSAYHRARAARQRVGVAAKAVEQAEAATRIVRDRYEHGLTTITEQLRAETALVRARLGLLAARYDYVVGHAELLRATGDLNNADEF
jgi:outer membrane protein